MRAPCAMGPGQAWGCMEHQPAPPASHNHLCNAWPATKTLVKLSGLLLLAHSTPLLLACTRHPLPSRQLHTEYVSLMSRVYAAHFKTYLGAMEKMQVSCAGPGDLLGAADSGAAASMASVMAMFGGKQQGKASLVSGWVWGSNSGWGAVGVRVVAKGFACSWPLLLCCKEYAQLSLGWGLMHGSAVAADGL